MELFKLLGTVAIDTTEANRNISDTSKKSQDLGDDFGKIADKAAEFSAKVLATTEIVVTAIGGMAVASSMQMESALDGFAASTGTVNEELAEYEDTLKEIYADNYGESFEDIAKSMAEIKKQVGDISADELKEMTKDALLLRDTFDFEVNESTRAAKMLMDQFGITGKEAFNLIAQGAQNGLDKNGDLLDSINEYAVHYKQMGYSASQFFNSLKNGTKAGTFSVDKLGDAMKEFGIRVKDVATTTTDAYALIGYGAEEAIGTVGETGVKVIGSIEEIQAKFAAGGEQAQEATAEVINALFAMEDKVAQNAAGVGLFGTMWEDLGIDGIKALTEVEGGIDTATDALTEMADVKYDNLNSEMDGLKKKIETTVITPLGQKVEPIVSKLIQKAEKKLPQIQKLAQKLGDVVVKGFDKLEPAMEWLIDDAFPVLIDILDFCIDNFDTLIGVVGTFYGVVKSLTIINNIKTAVEGASGAFQIFNGVLGACPAMAVVGAIGGLVIGIGALVSSTKEEKSASEKLQEQLNEERIAREEKLKAVEDEMAAIDKKAEMELVEIATVEDLWEELQILCDAQGNVKDADKARADFILNELNEALGTEYSMTGNQITQYQDMKTAVDDLILAKRAEILLSTQEEKYKTALQNMEEKRNEITREGIALDEAKEHYAAAEKVTLEDIAIAKSKIDALEKRRQSTLSTDSAAIARINDEIRAEQAKISQLEESLEREKAALDSKQANYDTSLVVMEQYYNEITDYENASALMLEGKTQEAIELLDAKSQAYLTAAELANMSAEEQKELLKRQIEEAELTVQGLGELVNRATEEQKAVRERYYNQALEHLEKCKEEYKKAGGDLADGITSGFNNKQTALKSAVQGAITAGAKDLKLDSFVSVGKNIVNGIVRGFNVTKTTLNGAMSGVINGVFAVAKEEADIHSPSRRAADEIGAFFPSGIAMGIEENEDDALDSVENMVGLMMNIGQSKASSVASTCAASSTDAALIALLVEKFNQLIAVMTQQRIYLNGDVLVGELAPAMNTELGNISNLTERGQ